MTRREKIYDYNSLDINNSKMEKHVAEKARSIIPAYPFKVKHVWVRKVTGLGITELMLSS
jgi:hypothetical protein